ncbi:uncharacterized protein LOC142977119 [Anticarsia gemmatalis]|uniref:uncharacterized protein LOC142977119 n=1 Tax=Anticarsia gemmatalis TaxID=129554 RepID=UPI003F759D03
MEQLQQQPAIPHLVQVYQPSVSNTIHISHPPLPSSQGKLTYQQSMTDSLTLPVSSHHVTEIQTQIQISQNQIVMSCQQGLQNLQPLQNQSQILQSSDMTQSLQIASHVLLPQHMLVNGMSPYYKQYEYPKEHLGESQKEHSLLAKLEPEMQLVEKEMNCNTNSTEKIKKTKGTRRRTANPTAWVSNVRKLQHQRGEAYISRRGKFVPERQIRTTKDCLKSCKYKCSEKISDADREQIFKAFYSLNANEKRFFLLSTTERYYTRRNRCDIHKRKYCFKYFFQLKSDRHTVCKKFYLGTLAISQKPIYNVHMKKTDVNTPKPDGRGHNKASTHALPIEVKDRVRKHICSFTTVDSKPIIQHCKKKQYLDPSLSKVQMYNMYVSECSRENSVPVKESMYRKIVNTEFNICFRKVKTESQLCDRCKETIKKK